MDSLKRGSKRSANRRSFLKTGTFGAAIGATLLSERAGLAADPTPLTGGDIAILRFLSALEQVESDLWIQYSELGGATNQGLSPIDLVLNGKKISTGLA